MKKALSISLGGELVSSEDCDYHSYLQRQLVCPVCNNPVFWVAGGKVEPHQRRGKTIPGFTRESHFSHFHEKDRINDCENRAEYSQSFVEAKQAIARNQRLSLFVGNFYKILQKSSVFSEIKEQVAVRKMQMSGVEERAAYNSLGSIFLAFCRRMEISKYKFGDSLHQKIAGEAFGFLLSEQGCSILVDIFWILQREPQQLLVLKAEELKELNSETAMEIIQKIHSVEWGEIFCEVR
jgi:hypothetical protein